MISNTLVHERNKVTRVLEQVAPYRVISRPRLSRDNVRQGLALFLEGCNLVADLNRIREELPGIRSQRAASSKMELRLDIIAGQTEQPCAS
jgi:hypothetical protein